MASITELRLQLDKPDVIIRPDVKHIGYMDRVKVSEVVKLGEKAVMEALPDLRKAVDWKARFSRWLS